MLEVVKKLDLCGKKKFELWGTKRPSVYLKGVLEKLNVIPYIAHRTTPYFICNFLTFKAFLGRVPPLNREKGFNVFPNKTKW